MTATDRYCAASYALGADPERGVNTGINRIRIIAPLVACKLARVVLRGVPRRSATGSLGMLDSLHYRFASADLARNV